MTQLKVSSSKTINVSTVVTFPILVDLHKTPLNVFVNHPIYGGVTIKFAAATFKILIVYILVVIQHVVHVV